ncbi:MAG TPA: ABC transporter permease [Pyrinomonadaceae bacterium]|nr:ABC transporter permease [Pyrinomonadaceae bacterium]
MKVAECLVQGPEKPTNEAICTIIAKNYLAFARTLAQSFLDLHPDRQCYVLIVDDSDGYVNPAEESFQLVKLSDLQIPNAEHLCFQYELKELCTSVKAHLLEHLIRKKSVDRLLYLDPDILVTAPLDNLFHKLRTYDIVLTPHLDHDYPDDGMLPDDGYILRAGTFNLGFLGVNSSLNTLRFLDWWKPKLANNCIVDPLNGYFVDQKFIDLVPLFFDNVFVEKHVGYNVAYWNIHSRTIERDGDNWRCNDGPLYFFHFSGYSPHQHAISTHLALHARHQLDQRSDLSKLFASYKQLLRVHGYERTRRWPYTFGFFNTGEPIPAKTRRRYRTLKWNVGENPFGSSALKQLGTGKSHSFFASDATTSALTADDQLEAIFNSRAWRWVSLYGRLKRRVALLIFERIRSQKGETHLTSITKGKESVGTSSGSAPPQRERASSIPRTRNANTPSNGLREPLVKIRPRRGWSWDVFLEVWRHLDLFYFLIWRDLKVRYRQTILGASWILLQPLLMTLIFVVFLGVLGHSPAGRIPYPLFLYAALMAWTFFANAVSGASFSLTANAPLITKVYLPRAIVPTAMVVVRLMDFLVASIVLLSLLIYYRVFPGWGLLIAPALILQLMILATATGLWFSALNVKYRDVGTILPLLLQLWLFASPIIYPRSYIPARWRSIYDLNPLVGIFENLRASLFGLPFQYRPFAKSIFVTFLLLAFSIYVFTRIENEFADRV